jgi:hypothetical protein
MVSYRTLLCAPYGIPRYNELAKARHAGGIMGRDLVWLEDYSFAAWGCAACIWIAPNLSLTRSGKASTAIRAAFDRHDCKKFPRHISTNEKRPSRKALDSGLK